jgi:hypothetical protein
VTYAGCLALKVSQDHNNRTISLSQTAYIDHIVNQFNLENTHNVWIPLNPDAKALSSAQSPITDKDIADMAKVPYRAAIGSMMYAVICTQPDIAFSVNRLAQFLTNPGRTHWSSVQQVLSYLKTTRSYRLVLGGRSGGITLTSSADSDYTSDIDS